MNICASPPMDKLPTNCTCKVAKNLKKRSAGVLQTPDDKLTPSSTKRSRRVQNDIIKTGKSNAIETGKSNPINTSLFENCDAIKKSKNNTIKTMLQKISRENSWKDFEESEIHTIQTVLSKTTKEELMSTLQNLGIMNDWSNVRAVIPCTKNPNVLWSENLSKFRIIYSCPAEAIHFVCAIVTLPCRFSQVLL